MKRTLIITFGLIFFWLFPCLVKAATFNPGNIISTREFTDYTSMSAKWIQDFLTSKSGILKNTLTEDATGVAKYASVIIYEAANNFVINPKLLLVLLQKEQSLISNPNPSQRALDWAMGYAVCDDCSTSDPDIQEFRGFGQQVWWAAKQNRKYLDKPQNYHFQVGETYNIDGQEVTVANQATAALYNYTPHLAGNESFFRLWSAWFSINYPDGSLLQVEGEKGIWLLQNGKKRPFLSRAAFVSSYDPRKVIAIAKNELDAYELGDPIKYPEFSLLRAPGGQIYFLINNELRQINAPETFRQLGFNPEEILDIPQVEIDSYPRGAKITLTSVYPNGALLQLTTTGGIFYVENGIKHAIWSKEILQSRYKNRPITKVGAEEINQYQAGEPVKFKDGELVTSPTSRSVYVISNGAKRPFPSGEIFTSLGYKWANITRTTDQALAIHPDGGPMTGSN